MLIIDSIKLLAILGKSNTSTEWQEICDFYNEEILEAPDFSSAFCTFCFPERGIKCQYDKRKNHFTDVRISASPKVCLVGPFFSNGIPLSGDRGAIHSIIGKPSWVQQSALKHQNNKNETKASSTQQATNTLMDGYVSDGNLYAFIFNSLNELETVLLTKSSEFDEIRILRQTGRIPDAAFLLEKKLLEKAGNSDDDVSLYIDYLQIADCYEEAGDFEKAEQFFLGAIAKSAPSILGGKVIGSARKTYASFLRKQGRSTEALDQLVIFFREKRKYLDNKSRCDLRIEILQLGKQLGYGEERCHAFLKESKRNNGKVIDS